jgi:hypothetical protein
MNLYAMALLLYGSGFVGDCDTISLTNRLLAICAFRCSREEGAGPNERQADHGRLTPHAARTYLRTASWVRRW